MSITTNLYGKTNIKEESNYSAFRNVYHFVKNTDNFNGRVFSRFITFAVYNENTPVFLSEIKKDLKKGLLKNRVKDHLVMLLLVFTSVNKKVFIRLIHRVARC